MTVATRATKGSITQQARVLRGLKGQGWQTLASLAAKTNDPEASISRRIRELRALFHPVEKRRLATGEWQYRIKR